MTDFLLLWYHLHSHPNHVKKSLRRVGEHEKDKRRKERKGQRVVVLVALGFWTDGSGRREILDWEIAKSEEHTEWEKLLNRRMASEE